MATRPVLTMVGMLAFSLTLTGCKNGCSWCCGEKDACHGNTTTTAQRQKLPVDLAQPTQNPATMAGRQQPQQQQPQTWYNPPARVQTTPGSSTPTTIAESPRPPASTAPMQTMSTSTPAAVPMTTMPSTVPAQPMPAPVAAMPPAPSMNPTPVVEAPVTPAPVQAPIVPTAAHQPEAVMQAPAPEVHTTLPPAQPEVPATMPASLAPQGNPMQAPSQVIHEVQSSRPLETIPAQAIPVNIPPAPEPQLPSTPQVPPTMAPEVTGGPTMPN